MSELQLITVMPDLTFEERIARGEYGWRNGDLNEANFTVTDDQFGAWDWSLFLFERNVSSGQALKLMRKSSYEAARTGHILAFGEKYGHEKEYRKFPIVGLGSVAEIDLAHTGLGKRIPGIWASLDPGKLNLGCFGYDWYDRYRHLLGVRRAA